MRRQYNRWTPERKEKFCRLYTWRIRRFYRSGIHSCAIICRKLGFKPNNLIERIIRDILLESNHPVRRRWTSAEIKAVRELYPTTVAREIAKKLNRTLTSVRQQANKLGVKPLTVRGGLTGEEGKEFRFKKGQKPWNAGMKNWQAKIGLSREKMANIQRTQFKKGQVSRNALHDGAITVHIRWKRGGQRRKFIRLGPMKWIELKNYIWQKHRGKPPRGMCVAFKNLHLLDKDGCPKCVISNLHLVDRAENIRRGLFQSDNYVASRIALKGTKGVQGRKGLHIDHELMRLALKNPALLQAKRRQLELKRRISEKQAVPPDGGKELPVQRRAV